MIAATASAAHASDRAPGKGSGTCAGGRRRELLREVLAWTPGEPVVLPDRRLGSVRSHSGAYRPGQGGWATTSTSGTADAAPTVSLSLAANEMKALFASDWYSARDRHRLGQRGLPARRRGGHDARPREGFYGDAAGRCTRLRTTGGFATPTTARASCSGTPTPRRLASSTSSSKSSRRTSTGSPTPSRCRRWRHRTGFRRPGRDHQLLRRSAARPTTATQIDRVRQLDAMDGKRQPIWAFVEVGWPFTQTAAEGGRRSHLLRCGRRSGSRSSLALVGSSTSTTPSAGRARRSTSSATRPATRRSRPN